MSDIDYIIHKLFIENWSGNRVKENINTMKKQLYKNLNDQINGYWSGSTAYHIMTTGGFLIDAKSGINKELTELGKVFIRRYEKNINKDKSC
jgi:hypothetical protein